MQRFLPMTADESKGKPLDIILVSGDAYVDHPGWGVALIGRWLELHGFRVGVIAQPDWRSPSAFEELGRPRLFFGVTAGNMDSMVNRFTASRHVRTKDAYSPGGAIGMRPDRASIPYTSMLRASFPGVPIVLGGIEASLRRMAHFDFWQDRVRGSILLDAKADLLVHGMGELPVLEIAQRLAAGDDVRACRDIPGVAYSLGAKEAAPTGDDVVQSPSFEECRTDGLAFNRMTKIMYWESNPHCGRAIVQPHGSRNIVINRPARPLTTEELDRVHELPYAYEAHSCYRQPIPALQSIQGSVAVNRGCSGGCSFCALTIHQGKDVSSRSEASVIREIGTISRLKGFKGIISDLGGPTANMFHMKCMDERANQLCRRVSCLHPVRCKHYGTDHKPYLNLLRKARNLPGIKRVFVNSGIRYDLAALDDEFVEELAMYHVQGQLSVAPEHASEKALKMMRKPPITHFKDFMRRFKAANEAAGKEQYVVPYFQCAHPGVGPEETIELALFMKAEGLRPRQVQMFMPTPATLATAMYFSGFDPHTKKPVYVAKGDRERSRQRALLLYWKREEWPHLREALHAWRRTDLIGKGPEYLVPPGPAYGAWKRKTQGKLGTVKATRAEESEENWESIVSC
jgi:uncharacterized radical SAM protein YgiQ